MRDSGRSENQEQGIIPTAARQRGAKPNMPLATDCLISAELAAQLRDLFVRKSGKRLGKVFRCKSCNRPVKPMVGSSVGEAAL